MLRFRTLLLMGAMLRAPENDDGTAGGAGGGAGDANKGTEGDEKKFTQAEVNRIVAARLAKESKGGSNATAELEKTRARLAELEAEVAEHANASTGSSADKAEAARLQRELAKANAARDEAQKLAATHQATIEGMTAREKKATIHAAVRRALHSSGAHESGIEQAVRLMAEEGEAELDTDGVTLTVNGVPSASGEAGLTKAARDWLQKNPHFAKSIGAGAGARLPNGNGGKLADLDSMTPGQMIGRGLRSKTG